jgi:hypothetical protein
MIDNKDNFTYFLTSKFNDECQFVIDNLNSSIWLLNSTFSEQSGNHWSIKLFVPLTSAFVGACLGSFLAFLFSRLNWKLTEKDKQEKEFFSKLSTLIESLETLSVEYWIKDHNEEDEKNEVYIKSKHRLLERYIREINTKDESIKKELENFASNIFDVITGDDFESKKRESSKSRAISISNKCADINLKINTKLTNFYR